MSVLTYKSMVAPNGLPGWRVLAGSNVLGTIFNPGMSLTNANSWYGVTPDGTRYEARAKARISDKLLAHRSNARKAGGG
jgi:hypothetical protein